mmetsp:Transcript_21975/g.43663  ORF Transcript_21975/g.43663 Transcript_21975/m.43663 type:complete len:204 (-) Transcript_21975:495-1106(-)
MPAVSICFQPVSQTGAVAVGPPSIGTRFGGEQKRHVFDQQAVQSHTQPVLPWRDATRVGTSKCAVVVVVHSNRDISAVGSHQLRFALDPSMRVRVVQIQAVHSERDGRSIRWCVDVAAITCQARPCGEGARRVYKLQGFQLVPFVSKVGDVAHYRQIVRFGDHVNSIHQLRDVELALCSLHSLVNTINSISRRYTLHVELTFL